MPDTKQLTSEPQKGRLIYMRPNFASTFIVGELSTQVRPDGRLNVVARKKGGRNRWNLCPLDYVLSFTEGEGWS